MNFCKNPAWKICIILPKQYDNYMALNEHDLAAIERLIHRSVGPMIDGLDDALSRQVAAGFIDMDRHFQKVDLQLTQVRAELALINDKLGDQHLRLDNHESRIAELEKHKN